MADDKNAEKPDKKSRGPDRRVEDDQTYKGPERRKFERRSADT